MDKSKHCPIDPHCKTYIRGTVTKKGWVCINCLIDEHQRAGRRAR